jgi:hypothetical protein
MMAVPRRESGTGPGKDHGKQPVANHFAAVNKKTCTVVEL